MTEQLFKRNFLKMHKKFLLMLCLVAAAVNFVAAAPYWADREVKGRIMDDKGAPLANVTVLVKGTTIGASSLEDGTFSVHVPDGKTTLVISSVGYQTQEVDIKNTSSVSVTLASGVGKLDDVVVVGYGTQKKITVTGAVASVKGTELQKSPSINMSNSLAGRLPGVTSVNGSGEPGYDGSSIRIRGSNTIGNSNALIVIDGMPNRAGGLDRLNPADIESISVLKDASAAIYGARAANGVILITTKHGKSGKPQLSYNFNQGWAQPTVIPKMLDAVEYATMANEIEMYKNPDYTQWPAIWAAYKSTGVYTAPNGDVSTAPFSPDDIKKYKDGSDPWGHPNTDWFKATLKDWAPQSKHNVQLTGGSENVKYLASIGYNNQDGIYKNSATGYKQYDFRLNLDAKVNKYVNVQLGVNGRQENRFFPNKSAGAIFRMLMRGYPYKNAYWPNGLPAPDIENGEQPVVITTNQTGYYRDTRYYLQTNGKLEILIPGVDGLKFTGNVALDKYIQQTKNWNKPWYVYNWSGFEADGTTPIMTAVQKGPTTQATLGQSSYDQLNALLEGILSYNHSFGAHAITLQAGITKETSNNSGFNAFRQYFPSTAIEQLFAGSQTDQKTGGSGGSTARLNYFGRVGYNYQEKYIAEFLWRYDGSYLFPADHRFGFFPGVSAGWRISEEEFFKKNIHFINSLKLRGSWGQLGNDLVYYKGSLIDYGYISSYNAGTYVVGNQVFSTLHESNIQNPNFTWEVANNTNVGLDATLLNNHLNVTFDVFNNKRSGILWKTVNFPATAGFGGAVPPSNFAKVENKGYEFSVGYNNNLGDFRYSVTLNGSYAKGKITYWDETPGYEKWQVSTGHVFPDDVNDPYGMLVYVYDGVFKDQKDVEANTLDYSGVGGAGKLFPGSMKFKDLNGDGKIDNKDRIRPDKNAYPTFQGGLVLNLGYKNFDLSVLFQSAAGGQFFFQTESGTIGNYTQWSYDHRWTVDNPSSVDPRTVDRNNQYFSNKNTYYMLNSNYVRLKTLELGYTLPGNLLKKAGISNLRVYVSGFNLLTWAKQDIYDPETTNSSGQYYPQSRIINTGVSVSF